MAKTRRKTGKRTKTSKAALQKENFQLRTKLGKLSTRDMQPDEAYTLNVPQLKRQRKEFTDLIAQLRKK